MKIMNIYSTLIRNNMIDPEIYEEIRNEELEKQYTHNSLMYKNEEDEDYFSNYILDNSSISDCIIYLKKECNKYKRDFKEELSKIADMI